MFSALSVVSCDCYRSEQQILQQNLEALANAAVTRIFRIRQARGSVITNVGLLACNLNSLARLNRRTNVTLLHSLERS